MLRPTRWHKLNGSFEQNALPVEPGVYVVGAGKRVLYVGQTRSIRARFSTYKIEFDVRSCPFIWRTPWGTHTDFWVKVSLGGKYGSWAMRELRLIKKLKPEFNQLFGTKKKAFKANG
jgi:hypothetical protein